MIDHVARLQLALEEAQARAARAELELALVLRRNDELRRGLSESYVAIKESSRAQPATRLEQVIVERDEIRRKLAAAHAELMRRHRRDQELARHLPAMAARLTAIAADCQEPESAPMPLEDVVDQDGW